MIQPPKPISQMTDDELDRRRRAVLDVSTAWTPAVRLALIDVHRLASGRTSAG